MSIHRRALLAAVGTAAASLSGCVGRNRGRSGTSLERGTLTVAVTTSTYDSGLVDELHAAFESTYGVTIRAISVGTGEALAAGERGDVDAVMAHAPSLEVEFVRAGFGINRRDVAFGDFVVAGPPDDRAAVAGAATARSAFERIAAAGAPFLSRGDDSGTHVKERTIWNEVGIEPVGEWYLEAGQGMGETLVQADQRGAYLLAVRGTLIAMRDRLDLDVVVDGPVTDGDPALDNPYGIIVVNPARNPRVAYELAMLYVGFLTGVRGQDIIEEYAIDGERPFFANGLSEEANLDQYGPRDERPQNAAMRGGEP